MSDEPFKEDIAALESEVKNLAGKRDDLRKKFDSAKRMEARYFHLQKQKEDLEREIAELEGSKGPDDEDGE